MNLETLRVLVGKGMSAQDILDIAEAMNTTQDEDIRPSRSPAAERQARYRARKSDDETGDATPNVTCDVTCNVTDDITRDVTCDVTAISTPSLSLLPNENNSNPSTHTHSERTTRTCDERDGGPSLTADAAGPVAGDAQTAPSAAPQPAAKRQRSKRDASDGSAIPEDWNPVLTPAAAGIVAKWPPGMLDREQLAFESHAASTGRTTKDWQAAFRTWLINADKRREDDAARRTNGRSSPASHHGADNRDGFQRALDREIFGDGYTPH